MTGFAKKLARLRVVRPPAREEALHTRVESLPGLRTRCGDGEVRVVSERFSVDYTHGEVSLGAALHVAAPTVARLTFDPAVEGLDLSRALFPDTETTGLAGGAGA